MIFRYIFLGAGASAGAVRVHHKKWVRVRVWVRVKNDGSLCTLIVLSIEDNALVMLTHMPVPTFALFLFTIIVMPICPCANIYKKGKYPYPFSHTL